jgi:hypothetical protein
LNDGRIQNPSNPFGIVPLSIFVPRGFGFAHHSIAILYHQVPNPNLTIRNFFIAVWGPAAAAAAGACGGQRPPQLLRVGLPVAVCGSPFGVLAPAHFANSVAAGIVSNRWCSKRLTTYRDGKVANREIRIWHGADRKGSLNDGRIQNPSNPFGIVPLSNFVPRGFKFVHH